MYGSIWTTNCTDIFLLRRLKILLDKLKRSIIDACDLKISRTDVRFQNCQSYSSAEDVMKKVTRLADFSSVPVTTMIKRITSNQTAHISYTKSIHLLEQKLDSTIWPISYCRGTWTIWRERARAKVFMKNRRPNPEQDLQNDFWMDTTCERSPHGGRSQFLYARL